jgi:hypothetical protein
VSAVALVGLSLLAGSVLFGVGAANPYLARAWTAPQAEFLRIVAARPGAWRMTMLAFIAGTVLVAAGFGAAPGLLTAAAARTVAIGGAVAYAIAAVLWILALLHRLAVTAPTARTFVETGVVDPAGVPLDRLMGACFKAFIVVGLAGVGAVGIALAMGDLVPALLGWGSAALSVLLVIGLLATGDMPPFTVYLAPFAFGIVILLH